MNSTILALTTTILKPKVSANIMANGENGDQNKFLTILTKGVQTVRAMRKRT
jgi:hypothetical protein